MRGKDSTFPPSHLPAARENKSGKVVKEGNIALAVALHEIAKIGKIYLSGQDLRISFPNAHMRRLVAIELELIQSRRDEVIELLRIGKIDLPAFSTPSIGKVGRLG